MLAVPHQNTRILILLHDKPRHFGIALTYYLVSSAQGQHLSHHELKFHSRVMNFRPRRRRRIKERIAYFLVPVRLHSTCVVAAGEQHPRCWPRLCNFVLAKVAVPPGTLEFRQEKKAC